MRSAVSSSGGCSPGGSLIVIPDARVRRDSESMRRVKLRHGGQLVLRSQKFLPPGRVAPHGGLTVSSTLAAASNAALNPLTSGGFVLPISLPATKYSCITLV